jgi:hypothetical protein
VKQIPRENTGDDAPDASSIAYELEQLFLEKLNPVEKEPKSKLYNVVFLTTKKYTNTSSMVIQECIKPLSDVKVGQLMYTPRLMHSDEYFRETDIYITSDDEEIKLGDWIIQTNYEKTFNELIKIETDFQLKLVKEKGSFTYRKIIATTNSHLNLPKLKKDFIIKFINSFNNNNLIDKVYVEMIQLSVKGNYQNKCVECGEIFNNSDKLNFICKKCGLKVKLNYNNEINIMKIDNYKNNDLWKKLN